MRPYSRFGTIFCSSLLAAALVSSAHAGNSDVDYDWDDDDERCHGPRTPPPACAARLELTFADFQRRGPQAPTRLRVFLAGGELTAVGGVYSVPLRGADGKWIKDPQAASHRHYTGERNSADLPKGAYAILRLGNGRVLHGLRGYMGQSSAVFIKATAVSVGAAVIGVHNYGPDKFERAGDGRFTPLNPGRDELRKTNAHTVVGWTTVTTRADFVVERLQCEAVVDRCAGVVCAAPNACERSVTCDPSDGRCKVANVADNTPCDDGNRCTVGDACVAGRCQAGTGALDCSDGNACTADRCDPQLGCVHTPPTCGGHSHLENNCCVCDAGFVDGGNGCACPAGTALCGGACVDLASNSDCGACGNACGTNAACRPNGVGGRGCSCDPGYAGDGLTCSVSGGGTCSSPQLQRIEETQVQLSVGWYPECGYPGYSENCSVYANYHVSDFGASATTTFNGIGVIWQGTKSYNAGFFRWVVDEGTAAEVSGTIDTYVDGVDRAGRELLTDRLSPGPHTLKYVSIGLNRFGNPLPAETYIDAFDVITSCQPPCPTGTASCSGTCADLGVSNQHCGACGHACAATAGCSSGVCVTLNACLSQFPLYVVERGSNELTAVDASGVVSTVMGGLSDPLALWTLPSGHLLVSERGTQRLTEVDPTAGVVISSAYPGFSPNDIFVDGDGTTYVTSFTGVWRKRPGEAQYAQFSSAPGDLTGMRRIGDYLFVPGIFDYGSNGNVLYRIHPSGQYEAFVDHLFLPLGIEVHQGGLLIMESNANRVSLVRGVLPGQTPTVTTFASNIYASSSIVTDCRGRYYVSHQANPGGVSSIDASGAETVLVAPTSALNRPRGVAFAQASPSQRWDFAADLKVGANHANPSPDAYGNAGVWHYQRGGEARTGNYTLLPLFRTTHPSFQSGLVQWGWDAGDGHPPYVTKAAENADLAVWWGTLPAGKAFVHPGPGDLVVIGWRSPLSGVVSVDGAVSHVHGACGNGVRWYVQKNGVDLASGESNVWTAPHQGLREGAGGASLASVVVSTGDFLHLVIDRDGDYSCDATMVDLTVSTP